MNKSLINRGYQYDGSKCMYYRERTVCCNAKSMTVVCGKDHLPADKDEIKKILMHMKTASTWTNILTYRQKCTKCQKFPADVYWDFKHLK